jgi:hypothetical protein
MTGHQDSCAPLRRRALLAIVDGDRTVRLWGITPPRDPVAVTAFDFNNQVDALTMSADGHQLFVATEETWCNVATSTSATSPPHLHTRPRKYDGRRLRFLRGPSPLP